MRILHFLGIGKVPKQPMVDATGGTERVALEIAKRQVASGHSVTVASFTNKAWSGTWQGVSLVHLKPYRWANFNFKFVSRDYRDQLRLAVLTWTRRFDIIHLHEHIRTRLLSPAPIIMQFHNNPLAAYKDKRFEIYAPHYWNQVSKSDAQIAVSEFVAERLRLVRRTAGSNPRPGNILVNQSGVDSPFFARPELADHRNEVRRQLGLGESDVLFLFVGAVRQPKGIDILARAFSRLSSEHPNACLAIAGGSSLWVDPESAQSRARFENEVFKTLKPAIDCRRVFNLGIVAPKDIASIYDAADVFVLPSTYQETFGLVILEAFAAGRPVIASKAGGIPELVKHRENGLLVALGNEQELYQAMREMLLDRDLRLRLAHEAKRTAQRFSWENTVQRLEAVYLDVLK